MRKQMGFKNLSVVEMGWLEWAGNYMAGSYGCRYIQRIWLRVPLHTFANCDISGQRPMNLYKEFPRVRKL